MTETGGNNIEPKQPKDNFEHARATVKEEEEELDEATLLATKRRILSLA